MVSNERYGQINTFLLQWYGIDFAWIKRYQYIYVFGYILKFKLYDLSHICLLDLCICLFDLSICLSVWSLYLSVLSLSLSCLSDSYKMHSLKNVNNNLAQLKIYFQFFFKKRIIDYSVPISIECLIQSFFFCFMFLFSSTSCLPKMREQQVNSIELYGSETLNMSFVNSSFFSFLFISTCIGLRSLESSLNIAVVITVIVKSDVKGINIMPCAYQKEIL